VGLLMLRVAAAMLILVTAGEQIMNGRLSIPSLLLTLLAIFIGLGLFTTPASSLAALLNIGLYLGLHDAPLLITITIAEVCIALSMMGAGAYSLDALLFGYRRVTLPR